MYTSVTLTKEIFLLFLLFYSDTERSSTILNTFVTIISPGTKYMVHAFRKWYLLGFWLTRYNRCIILFMMIAVTVFILHVTVIVAVILNITMISSITVLASGASQERAAAPCSKTICGVEMITVVVVAIEFNGVVNFSQNLI